MNIKVKWLNIFVLGHMDGVSIEQELDFNNLDSATRYMAFLQSHVETPVDPIAGSSKYTCHNARMITEE